MIFVFYYFFELIDDEKVVVVVYVIEVFCMELVVGVDSGWCLFDVVEVFCIIFKL